MENIATIGEKATNRCLVNNSLVSAEEVAGSLDAADLILLIENPLLRRSVHQ